MNAADPKDDDESSKTSVGRRASSGAPHGGSSSSAPGGCSSASSSSSAAAFSASPTMVGPANKLSKEERFPLVAKGTFPDLESGEGSADVPAGGTTATPLGVAWGGWRDNSNNCNGSSTDELQQGSTPGSSSSLSPQLPNEEQQKEEQEQPQQQLEQKQQQQQQHPRTDVRFTSAVFIIFFALEIFVNFDCGAIPCTLSRMADEFRLSPTWQGMLGALPYVGLTLASPFAGRIFAYCPAKRVVVVSMALNALATLLMVLTVLLPHEVLPLDSSSGDDVMGGAAGAAAADLAATAAAAEGAPGAVSAAAAAAAAAAPSRPFFRLPDFSFGDLTPCALLLLSSRLLVGYLAAGVLSVYLGFNWRAAISFQVFFLCVLTGLVASIPREFIQTPGGPGAPKDLEDAKAASAQPNAQQQQQQQEQQEQQQGQRQDHTPRDLSPTDSSPSPNQTQGGSAHRRKSVDVGRPPSSTGAWQSPPAAVGQAAGRSSRRNASLKLLLCVRGGPGFVLHSLGLFRVVGRGTVGTGQGDGIDVNPMYMLPVLTLCALLFVVTGVQFWGTIFFASFLGLSPAAAVGAFAAVAATSPVAGVLMGGLTVDAVGGYKTLKGRTRTLAACTAYAAVAVACAVVGSFSFRVYVCVACLWLLLCFGAAMLPPLTGIQIDAVSPDLRTLASGISMFFYNILGYALGAFLPGVAMDLFHGGDVLGLRLVLLWSVFGLLFSSITLLYAWRLERKETAAAFREVELSVQPSAGPPPFTVATSQPNAPKRSRVARGFLPITVDSVWQQQQPQQQRD
ncbi:hypothetical protein, conserved [Eimeria brunetti]|uniref:Transporter, major facilitator family domain containing protein n=1 Tax=Eimeria brunetti TaxID=51314 RepID=U6LNG8_9EIME|nr:hypothetical protein, conserved [Eimeria brunetti]